MNARARAEIQTSNGSEVGCSPAIVDSGDLYETLRNGQVADEVVILVDIERCKDSFALVVEFALWEEKAI